MATVTAPVTPLVCSECWQGEYLREGFGLYGCTNPDCDHKISSYDLVLDEGERVYITNLGRLAIVTPAA